MNPISLKDKNITSEHNRIYSSIQTEPKIQLIKNKNFNLISSGHSQPVYFIKKNKRKKPLLSDAQKKERIFNRLYGTNKAQHDQYNKIRKERILTLTEHQNELIKLGTNLGKGSVMKLLKEFKTLRIETSLTVPLPPINYNEIVEEAKKSNLKDPNKHYNQAEKSRVIDPDLEAIKNYKKAKANPSLMKMYEILPEYIVNIFAGRIR